MLVILTPKFPLLPLLKVYSVSDNLPSMATRLGHYSSATEMTSTGCNLIKLADSG